jgi:hypothetical protein
MQLFVIAGWPQTRTIRGIPSGAAAWRETLALAVELDDVVDYQLRAIWALWVDRGNNGEPAEADCLADRFVALAQRTGDSQDQMIGQRLRGHSSGFKSLGQRLVSHGQKAGRQLLQRRLFIVVDIVALVLGEAVYKKPSALQIRRDNRAEAAVRGAAKAACCVAAMIAVVPMCL